MPLLRRRGSFSSHRGGQICGLDLIGSVVIAGCRSEPKHPRSEKIWRIRFHVSRPASSCEHRVLVLKDLQETSTKRPQMTAEASAAIGGEI